MPTLVIAILQPTGQGGRPFLLGHSLTVPRSPARQWMLSPSKRNLSRSSSTLSGAPYIRGTFVLFGATIVPFQFVAIELSSVREKAVRLQPTPFEPFQFLMEAYSLSPTLGGVVFGPLSINFLYHRSLSFVIFTQWVLGRNQSNYPR